MSGRVERRDRVTARDSALQRVVPCGEQISPGAGALKVEDVNVRLVVEHVQRVAVPEYRAVRVQYSVDHVQVTPVSCARKP